MFTVSIMHEIVKEALRILIIVVPPATAACVPSKKSSAANVPMNGSCICVWGSIPPDVVWGRVISW